MKKIILFLALCLPISIVGQNLFLTHFAQMSEVDTLAIEESEMEDSTHVVLIFNDMANANIFQDSVIIRMIEDKQIGRVRGEQVVDGFRVQVYASNMQQTAKNEALMLQQRIETALSVPVYALSEPPFWKVRLGNFKTREDANAYKETFLSIFPDMVGSTYVVPDKIILVE